MEWRRKNWSEEEKTENEEGFEDREIETETSQNNPKTDNLPDTRTLDKTKQTFHTEATPKSKQKKKKQTPKGTQKITKFFSKSGHSTPTTTNFNKISESRISAALSKLPRFNENLTMSPGKRKNLSTDTDDENLEEKKSRVCVDGQIEVEGETSDSDLWSIIEIFFNRNLSKRKHKASSTFPS